MSFEYAAKLVDEVGVVSVSLVLLLISVMLTCRRGMFPRQLESKHCTGGIRSTDYPPLSWLVLLIPCRGFPSCGDKANQFLPAVECLLSP